jgi:hypothetical protein
MSNIIDWTGITSSTSSTSGNYETSFLDYFNKYYDKGINIKKHDYILEKLEDLENNRQAVKRVQSHIKEVEEKMLLRGSITGGTVDELEPVEEDEEPQEVQYFDPKDLDI